MLNVRLAGDHLYGKLLFTWLSLVMSMIVSFCAVLFPTRCLGWDLELNWVSFWGFSFLLLRWVTLTFQTIDGAFCLFHIIYKTPVLSLQNNKLITSFVAVYPDKVCVPSDINRVIKLIVVNTARKGQSIRLRENGSLQISTIRLFSQFV